MYPREARTAMGQLSFALLTCNLGYAPYVFEGYFAEALLEQDERTKLQGIFFRSIHFLAWAALVSL